MDTPICSTCGALFTLIFEDDNDELPIARYCSCTRPPARPFAYLVANGQPRRALLSDPVFTLEPVHYLSLCFKPAVGNGPYFYDTDFQIMISRMLASEGCLNRWATIAEAGRPIGLWIDIDINWPLMARPSADHIKVACLFWINRLLVQLGRVPIPDNSLIWFEAAGPKLSLHGHSDFSLTFKDMQHQARFWKLYACQVAAAVDGDDEKAKWAAQQLLRPGETGKLLHAVDLHIYQSHRVFRLPYAAKPRKNPLLPCIPMPPRTALEIAVAHHPIRDSLPAEALVMLPEPEPVDRAPPLLRTPSTLASPSPPPPPAASPAHSAVITELMEFLAPKCASAYDITYKRPNMYYVQFRVHPHICWNGVTHTSNNAFIKLVGLVASWSCFGGAKCKTAAYIGRVSKNPDITAPPSKRPLETKDTPPVPVPLNRSDTRFRARVKEMNRVFYDAVTTKWQDLLTTPSDERMRIFQSWAQDQTAAMVKAAVGSRWAKIKESKVLTPCFLCSCIVRSCMPKKWRMSLSSARAPASPTVTGKYPKTSGSCAIR